MRDGYDFRTHEWSQTVGAKNVWERLAQAGVLVWKMSLRPMAMENSMAVMLLMR